MKKNSKKRISVISKLVVLGLCCISLSACSGTNNNKYETISSKIEETKTEEIEVEVENETEANFDELNQSCIEVVLDREVHLDDEVWKVDILQPKLVLKEGVNHPILEETINTINAEIQTLANTEYTDETKEFIFNGRGGTGYISEKMKYDVIRCDEEQFALWIEYREPCRGISYTYYYPIDLSSGKSLSFSELFECDYENYLALMELIDYKVNEIDSIYFGHKEYVAEDLKKGDSYYMEYYFEESGNLHIVLNNGFFSKAVSTIEISVSKEEFEEYNVILAK